LRRSALPRRAKSEFIPGLLLGHCAVRTVHRTTHESSRHGRYLGGMDIRAPHAYNCHMNKHMEELPAARTPATAIGAHAIGAQGIGGLAIGALAVGAVAVGTLALGRLIIGRLTVRRTRLGVVEIDELRVGRLHLRELVVDDRR
jgi:hypothetical protein